MQATICLNKANPGCSPKGTTILSMTALAGPDAWKDVKPEEYATAKQTFARAMIDQFGRALNCPLWEHIEEVEIAAPPTFARYTGAFKGTIYAYEQDPWDSVVARALAAPQERFIRGWISSGGGADGLRLRIGDPLGPDGGPDGPCQIEEERIAKKGAIPEHDWIAKTRRIPWRKSSSV